jgi:hypothetical protein
MRLSQEDTASLPVWQHPNPNPREQFSAESASDASSSELGGSMDREMLEKDVRFQMEEAFGDEDEGVGFIDGSRKVGCIGHVVEC